MTSMQCLYDADRTGSGRFWGLVKALVNGEFRGNVRVFIAGSRGSMPYGEKSMRTPVDLSADARIMLR